jgi:hypothetical protein
MMTRHDLGQEPEEDELVPVQPRPVEVVESIQDPSLSTLRVQYDAMSAMASGFERNVPAIIDTCIGTVEAYPDLAERGVYAIPYKTHTEKCKKGPRSQRANCSCPVDWVVGPGIHLATLMADEWGCCVDGARIYTSSADGGADLIEGFFLDFVKRRMIVRQRIVPRFKRTRSGEKYAIPQDAYHKEVEIHASKMHRNCILKGLPAKVTYTVYHAALRIKEATIHREGLAETWNKVLAYFEPHGGDEEAVLRLLSKDDPSEVTAEDISNLRALVQSDRAGFTRARELFRIPDRETTNSAATGSVESVERGD